MDLGHAYRFAAREARLACGDLYPGPVLVPHGILRAVDPLLALALGPARCGSESFATALERTLRGRPDGPLLLALWASAGAGELEHADLRALMSAAAAPPPESPATRADWIATVSPGIDAMARCVLAIAQRDQPEARAPATRLGCGLVLTRTLLELPAALQAGRQPLPAADLAAAGCSTEELRAGVRTPAVDLLLRNAAQWARTLLDEGLPVCEGVGSRFRRGLRAAVLRARRLLDKVEDPRSDLFRRPPALSRTERWACALRATWLLKPGPDAGP